MIIKLYNAVHEASKTTGLYDKIGIPAWILSFISVTYFKVTVADLELTNQILKLAIQSIILVVVVWRAWKTFKKG